MLFIGHLKIIITYLTLPLIVIGPQALQCTCILKSLVTSTLVTQPAKNGYCVKELYALVIAVHTWGTFWKRQKIFFHCDNRAVVDIWGKGSTRAPQTMALVCLLYFCATYHNINVCIVYVSGVFNDIADSLSLASRFRRLVPQANLEADNILV